MTNTVKPETAGVIAPPPLIHLAGLAIAIVLDYAVRPLPITDGAWRWLPAALLISSGAVFIALPGVRFRLAKTALRPWKPTTALVTDGIYRLSRNPIYVGMALVYAGLGFGLNTIWAFGLLVVVLPVMHFGVIRREEKYLETLFGDNYRAYKETTPRWL